MIYIFNERLTTSSSGIEYAEAQLLQILKELDVDFRMIFTGWTRPFSLVDYSDKMNYPRENIVSVFHHLTDLPLYPSSLLPEEVLAHYPDFEFVKQEEERIFYKYDQLELIFHLIEDKVNEAVLVRDRRVLRVDSYTRQLSHSEFYDNTGRLTYIEFYNQDGSCGLRETINEWDSTFEACDNRWESKHEFMKAFMERLQLTSSDIIIMDRPTFIDADVLPFSGAAKVITMIHAEHFIREVYPERLIFNPHYQYTFMNPQFIDVFRVMTQAQKEQLEEHLERIGIQKNIVVIPPTFLEEAPNELKKELDYRLLTVSRLAPEKRFDLLIPAIARACQELPQLRLDIYGGGDIHEVQDLIDSVGMQDRIFLKGHTENIMSYYSQYDAYISTSPSESFGLSIFEAMSQGLPFIFRNVPYGNQEAWNQNGLLVEGETDDEVIENTANAIVQFYREDRHAEYQQNSLSKAKQYSKEIIKQKWKELLETI
ncbi:glycosyltransferase [Streptococcus sp. zg-86]|uniref:Glycosyltransferase n=1 Tax=Streptococcus zhangguiae TaxID=2664091 RepID=A0A6I4RIQ1_9STRE|nr:MULTISPECIES: glycosyltransferase [unclassified Streptococcus]MTB64322.1 glycosyltransferase [Streptococcus sp. zg-86]MTB90632.1 glycosyltransferase [Streptococcus sp. zg-36]MWV56373.1 glycosyltransferase [Streptococcus sp. zg-70]QTH47415.1 glycosyltransferase [Streptococcus sp. zg-86]